MKFLTVRELRGNAARVWRELPKEKEMLVTRDGKPVAMLTAVDETNVEETLSAWRKSRAIQAVADIQQESVKRGLDKLSMTDVNATIRKVRKKRSKSIR